MLTAFAGVVAAARTNGVTPGNAGGMRELHVITAVVIGGTSLTGRRGTMAAGRQRQMASLTAGIRRCEPPAHLPL